MSVTILENLDIWEEVKKRKRYKPQVYIYIILYNSTFVEKYDLKISIKTKLLSRVYLLIYPYHLRSEFVNFFMRSLLVNKKYCFVILVYLGVPLGN